MSRAIASPGQTIGPFFGFALPYPGSNQLVPPGSPGAVQLAGQVLDGHGAPVPDALLELWQAAPNGSVVEQSGSLCRDGWTFTGWGRAATNRVGRYTFTTLEPGSSSGRPPFFALAVFARGLENVLFTRAYVPGEAAALAGDPLLAALPDDRRATLIARRDGATVRFDVHLQGERETVFLRYPGQPAR